MDSQDFIKQIAPAAITAYKKHGVLPSLTIAQAILESNWGNSAPGFMLFGIKWSEGCGRDKQLLWTTEYINGTEKKVQDWFRKYNSYAESIDDHGKFLKENSRYKPVLVASNYNEACTQIQACGYATDPNYANQLINIVKQYVLNKYDEVAKMDGVQAIEYLVSKGKILDGDGWKKALTAIKNVSCNIGELEQLKKLEFVFIKWAQDVV